VPAAEIAVDDALVRGLLEDQHRDLAARPLRAFSSGWDNVLYRLGDDLLVRLPRRQLAADLVAGEHRWLPLLARRLPLPIAAPLRRGAASDAYPWAWSICPFFAGADALATPPTAADTAQRLGAFVAALHRPAPADAPTNAYRGVPLAARDKMTRERIATLAGHIDSAAALALWSNVLAAAPYDGDPLWLHGDLHPGNLIVDDDGAVCAVVDFGARTAGDPATDLSLAWTLFDDPHDREEFLRAADASDDALQHRARGWALTLAIACLAHSADAPHMRRLGDATLRRLCV